MKAICIIGSPKSNGSTACIADTIIRGMRSGGIDVQRYVLGEMEISYCKGCKSCTNTGKCVQDDDMQMIIHDLFASDIVLIASPSYWGDVTGQLKVFFDRSTQLLDANGETILPKGKAGISVAVRAGRHIEENMHLIQTIEHYFGHLGIVPVQRFTVEGVQSNEDFGQKEDKVHEAYELGKRILERIV